ncbi:response regulator [uncultured Clostridium sp.]|uniref:response regulator transcription factor n=1 Tax=uncultured Clostridium sp. TaxID=59620 RepID=UPI0025F3AF15|nr:response regulator [uncultured Clostridium sp.]
MCRILLADDEYLEIEVLKSIISKEMGENSVVGEARNGKQVIEMNETLNPDIIFMDIKMPVMNGLEVAQMIKEKDKNKPIVLISAYGDFEYTQKAIRVKVDDYLLKPVRPEKIIQLLRKFISSDKKYFACKYKFKLLENIKEFRYRQAKIILLKIIKCIEYFSMDDVNGYCIKLARQMTNLAGEMFGDVYFRRAPICDFKTFINIEDIKNYLMGILDGIFDIIIDNKFFLYGNEMKFVLNFVEKNFKSNITLKDAAAYVNLSVSYLSKLFKKSIGMNFNEYLTSRRIEEAKIILSDRRVSINNLAFNVGYNEPNYFCRVFKRKEGITPSEYRKKLNKK